MKVAVIMFVFLLLAACAKPVPESGLMREEFWDKGENSDIPWAFESVCVGDPECGDGHFGAESHHFLVHYTKYESPELAEERLEREMANDRILLRQGSVADSRGNIVGRKAILKHREKDSFELSWTRGSRFASVKANSLEGIELYEKDRGL